MPGLRHGYVQDIKAIGSNIADSKDKSLLAARLGIDKKGENIVILDMRDISGITDFFVIITGNSSVHTKAMGDWIKESLAKRNINIWHTEGYRDATWILLDYGDVIINIFQEEARKFYDLEHLWAGAPRINIGG